MGAERVMAAEVGAAMAAGAAVAAATAAVIVVVVAPEVGEMVVEGVRMVGIHKLDCVEALLGAQGLGEAVMVAVCRAMEMWAEVEEKAGNRVVETEGAVVAAPEPSSEDTVVGLEEWAALAGTEADVAAVARAGGTRVADLTAAAGQAMGTLVGARLVVRAAVAMVGEEA